jgi:NAD(P)-dependent dehydrogenase (short-subunit alcohol dehydrogenase family)
MKRFQDRIVIVTGAGSGIGRATAVRLAEEGASLGLIDLNRGGLEETATTLEKLRTPFALHAADVSDPEGVRRTVAAVVERFGKLHVLCNVAGILRADHSHELALADWNKILAVNLTGTFLMCQAAIPHLLATKGAIVNMSSNAALGGHPWMAAYAASKGGVLSLTRCLALEYVKQGLRVNGVCGGAIATPMHGSFKLPEGADFTLLQRAMPINGVYATPEQAASVIAFLASDDASYMTGADVRVDGGSLS